MVKVGLFGVAGGAGVGISKSRVLIGMAKGAAGFRTHGDRSNGARMAGEATEVNFGVVGINGKNGAVAVGDTGRGPTRDKLTVIRGMIYQAIGMAVFASDHRPPARLGGLGLEDGGGDRVIDGVNGDTGGDIGPDRIMAGAATANVMLIVNGAPRLNLALVAIDAATALAR